MGALTFAHWALEGANPDRNPVELQRRGTIVSRRLPDGYLADRARDLDEPRLFRTFCVPSSR